jgi:ADP-ribosylglycohydrolase
LREHARERPVCLAARVPTAARHAPPRVLRGGVQEALLCTHVHPAAVDGALVVALAVARLAVAGGGEGKMRRGLKG